MLCMKNGYFTFGKKTVTIENRIIEVRKERGKWE